MTLYTDIPSRAEITSLWERDRGPAVSIYLETEPDSPGEIERIAYRNSTREALAQLGDADPRDIQGLAEELAILEDDASEDFWQHQARSLAVFATPASLRTFRLPNRLTPAVFGGDRFFIKPLLRAVTFPQSAFVLALAQGSVRLLEAVADASPRPVKVPGLPRDVASAVGKSSIKDRAPVGRIQGSEGQKVRMAQFARAVDKALREALPGGHVPLVLAATEPLDSIFRAHCSLPGLLPASVVGNPEGTGDVELVTEARQVLDQWHADQLAQERATYAERAQQGRAATDVADLARFSTRGAVETLFLDIDTTLVGEIDPLGEVTFDVPESAGDVLDEIARRAWLSGARVLAVRREDVPWEGPVAATLRYAPAA